MKTHPWLGMVVGAAVVAAAGLMFSVPDLLARPAAKTTAGVAGKVTFLKGKAKHGMEGSPLKPLRRNDKVREGELLKTGAGTRLELKLADGSIMRLAPNSSLKVGVAKSSDPAAGKDNGQHKLTAGKMWAKITKSMGHESKFAVRTENAVAGVRGTTFRVNAEEDGATVVKVYEGAVAVSNGPLVEKAASGTQGRIDFKNRKEVAAPFHEVSLQEWEKIVGAMKEIRVAANGAQTEPTDFTAQSDAANKEDAEWVAWNNEMDGTKQDVPQ